MTAFPKTRAAARYAAVRGRGGLTSYHAAVVEQRLRACEEALSGGDAQPPDVSHALMPGLVLAARDLAGRAWLAASGDDPDIAAFTALETTAVPPAPAELDEIISRVLWARFAPQGTGEGSPPSGERRSRPGAALAAGGPAREMPGGLGL